MDERDSKVEEREEERGGALIFLKKEFRDERGGVVRWREGGCSVLYSRRRSQPEREGEKGGMR